MIVLLLLLCAVCGAVSYAIANAKGLPAWRYFWLGFLFPIIGLLLVLGMPSRKPIVVVSTQEEPKPAPAVEEPDSLPESKEEAINLVTKKLRIPQLFSADEISSFSDGFKIFLIDYYGVRKHEVLGKYIFQDRIYDTLESALEKTRAHYLAQISPVKQLRDVNWESTRDKIRSGTYLGPNVSPLLTRALGTSVISVYPDGAFEVQIDGNRQYFGTRSEAEDFVRSNAPFSGSDPIVAKQYLEARGYVVRASGKNHEVVTPQGVIMEAWDSEGLDQLLVQLATEDAQSKVG